MTTDHLSNLIEQQRGNIEHELGDFTVFFPGLDDDTAPPHAELLATAGYDWCNEGDVIAVARLTSRSPDARLVIDTDV